MAYQNTLDNLAIVEYRGIKCINTMPLELIWGDSGSVLECSNCMEYASDPLTKVLIGLCVNCADFTYNGKYGCGYYINLTGLEINDVPLAFGNLNTYDVIRKLHDIYENENENENEDKNENENNYKQNIVNDYKYVYSFYNLSLLSHFDINLLRNKNNYG